MSKFFTEGEYQMARLMAKASKTDKEFQEFLVRKSEQGEVEYFHPQRFDWYTCPGEWAEKIEWPPHYC